MTPFLNRSTGLFATATACLLALLMVTSLTVWSDGLPMRPKKPVALPSGPMGVFSPQSTTQELTRPGERLSPRDQPDVPPINDRDTLFQTGLNWKSIKATFQRRDKIPAKPVSTTLSSPPLQSEITDSVPATAFLAQGVDLQAAHSGALIKTEKGDMVVELFAQDAPITVANFQRLVGQQFYSSGSMVFHRVIPGFMAQTGDPTGTGMGGSDKKIPLEIKAHLSHTGAGILAMARSSDPDSASSQFYITSAAQPSLDGKYAVFGRVIQGVEVISKLEKGDRLYSITFKDITDVPVEKGAPSLDTFGFRMKRLVKPGPKTKVRAR
jgi:cyclophilin family peptidyl-prolyl cis-trans isomerase